MGHPALFKTSVLTGPLFLQGCHQRRQSRLRWLRGSILKVVSDQAGGISREDAVALVRQLQNAQNAHDTSRLIDLYAEDAVVVSPVFKTVSGRAAIANAWDVMFSTFPDWNVSVSDVLVDGSRVAPLTTNTATDLKGWFGLPPTGGSVGYRATLLLTLAGTKIVREERLYEMTAVLESLEKARLDGELRTAAQVQAALLSRSAHVGRHYDALGDSAACRTIGGDFFEFIELPSGDFGVALGDVAGKGPAAALLAALLQGMFTVEARRGNSPALTLSRVNRELVDRGLGSRFATLVYGVLSPDGRFIYSNAGNNPPILWSHGRIRRLTTGGTILGAFSGAAFEEETLHLDEQDIVVMFTDGVTDARNRHDKEFGEDRLISCVTAHHAQPTSDVVKAILGTVWDFCEKAQQTDDITVVVTRFRSEPK